MNEDIDTPENRKALIGNLGKICPSRAIELTSEELNSLGDALLRAVTTRAFPNGIFNQACEDLENERASRLRDIKTAWHCCMRMLRSPFCPNCGRERTIDPQPPRIQDLEKQARQLVAFFEGREMASKNAARTHQENASRLRDAIKHGSKIECRYSSRLVIPTEGEARMHDNSAAGSVKKALNEAHWKHVVMQLMEKSGFALE